MAIPQPLRGYFQPLQTTWVATCEADQPRVRPMILILHEGAFYLATGTADAKTPQLLANPRLEWCLPLTGERGSGYVRGQGTAQPVSAPAERAAVHAAARFIQGYFSTPADPAFALFRLRMTRYEHMAPGQDTVTRYNEETA